MESLIPPSYEEATKRDHWAIIAKYIESSDLCAASLVSKRWHDIFTPYLWGSPARHFGTENDAIYGALVSFKRTLHFARANVRQLTHTLYLPSALSEIYYEPKPEWLRNVLVHLPNLQSLIVSGLPFFDHSSLLALRLPRSSQNLTGSPTYPLRLLVATSCDNTTSAGLAEALLHLQGLVFLDLSNTTSARDKNVLSSLRVMPGLRVLKLRSVGLRDEDVESLADAVGLKLRSLDMRENRITDSSIRSILEYCSDHRRNVHAIQRRESSAQGAEEDWPSGPPRIDARILDEFRGDDLDERLVKKLTGAVVGRLSSDYIPHTGITHLYLANNLITVEGIASLLRNENLHVLDAGVAGTTKALAEQKLDYPRNAFYREVIRTQNLTPILEAHGRTNLTFLRIHHAVVTMPGPSKDKLKSVFEYRDTGLENIAVRSELEDNLRRELSAPRKSNEVDAGLPIYEMPVETLAPGYRLSPGPANTIASPSSVTQSKLPETTKPGSKQDASFSPEVVKSQNEDASSFTTSPVHESGISLNNTPLCSNISPSLGSSCTKNKEPHTQTVASEETQINAIKFRRRLVRTRKTGDQTQGLLPGLLPALGTLILTDVPNNDDTRGSVVSALKQFIRACALESQLALKQSILEHPSLHIAGHSRLVHQKNRSRELFALRRVVLEMAPDTLPRTPLRSPSNTNYDTNAGLSSLKTPGTPPVHNRSAFNQRDRSSTGDADVETFWAAQESDFTFFGEEEGELPNREAPLVGPKRSLGQNISIVSSNDRESLTEPTRGKQTQGKNVVMELAKWRAERRSAAQSLAKGELVDGHWEGTVEVVRPGSGQNESVNWYGNYLEKSDIYS